jgi:hypothetical protein
VFEFECEATTSGGRRVSESVTDSPEMENVQELLATTSGGRFFLSDSVTDSPEMENVQELLATTSGGRFFLSDSVTDCPAGGGRVVLTDSLVNDGEKFGKGRNFIMQWTEMTDIMFILDFQGEEVTGRNSCGGSGKRRAYMGDFKREEMNDEELARKFYDIANQYIKKLKLIIKDMQKSVKLDFNEHGKQESVKNMIQLEVFYILIYFYGSRTTNACASKRCSVEKSFDHWDCPVNFPHMGCDWADFQGSIEQNWPFR